MEPMHKARNTRAPRCTTSSKGIISSNAAIGVMPFRSLLNGRAFVVCWHYERNRLISSFIVADDFSLRPVRMESDQRNLFSASEGASRFFCSSEKTSTGSSLSTRLEIIVSALMFTLVFCEAQGRVGRMIAKRDELAYAFPLCPSLRNSGQVSKDSAPILFIKWSLSVTCAVCNFSMTALIAKSI